MENFFQIVVNWERKGGMYRYPYIQTTSSESFTSAH